MSSNNNKYLILDIGSLYLRLGYSNEYTPRHIVKHNIFNTELRVLRFYLQELFSLLFTNYYLIKSKYCNILVIEKIFIRREIRDFILTVLLEDFHVSSGYIMVIQSQ